MPWYYTGPDSKPVGPLTLQELQDKRSTGTISTETYIIEDTGQRDASWAWKRYREVFPAMPTFPPLPTVVALPSGMPPIPAPFPQPGLPGVAQPPVPPPRPLSSQAVPPLVPTSGRPSVFTSPHGPDPFYINQKKMNEWCAWGGGLGIASLPLLAVCLLGALLAPISLVMCIVGLAGRKPEETGRGLAITGLILSVLSIVAAIYLASALPPMLRKAAEQAQADQQMME